MKLFPVTCEFIKGEKQFYYRAQKFYEDVPASEEGMMGDFLEISNVDLESSRQFLKRFVVSCSIRHRNSAPQGIFSAQDQACLCLFVLENITIGINLCPGLFMQ